MTTNAAPRTLLIVDDEEANRSLLRAFFTKKGFDVRLSGDGEAAVAAATDDVDLVILDHMMPGLSGLDVLARLRGRGDDVPVMMLTAAGDKDIVVRAMQAGAQDFVTKPFSLPVLLQRVERALRQREPELEVVTSDMLADEVELIWALASSHAPPGDRPLRPPPPPPEDTTASVAMRPLGSQSTVVVPDDAAAGAAVLTRLVSHGAQPTLDAGVLLSGRYRLSVPIGTGAFGAVWRARHVDLDVDVAIKVLHRDAVPLRPNETALQSFRREAMLAARLTTPHAVRVTDFGTTAEGHAFLVMEHLIGETARHRLAREGPLAVGVACSLVADVCEALDDAHRHGIVHRDVKALNVFIARRSDLDTRMIVKLIDFGAAASGDDVTTGSLLVGTPSHMAPELFGDPRGTAASDVYAAGVLLFHLLTGTLPFVADEPAALVRELQTAKVPRPSARQPTAALADEVCLRLLSKAPSARPTAAEAAEALRAVAGRG